MIGPLLGAGVSLISAIMGANAQKRSTDLGYLNLYETRRSNKRQEREQRRVNDLVEALQKATRTDALGNKVGYDESLNAFTTDLTPMTEATLDNQQNELLRQLREDAPRNRGAAERRDRRSKMAEEEFERVFNQYRFRPRSSEQASISDATDELLSARQTGLKQAQNDIATTLLRQGNTSALSDAASAISEQYAGTLADAILEGKRVGSQRHRERESADTNQFLTELSQLRGIADDVVTSPVGQSNANEQLTGRADQALQQLIAAISQGGGNLVNVIGQGSNRESAVVQQLMQAIANSAPDLGGVASALSRISFEKRDPASAKAADPFFFPPAPPPPGYGLY